MGQRAREDRSTFLQRELALTHQLADSKKELAALETEFQAEAGVKVAASPEPTTWAPEVKVEDGIAKATADLKEGLRRLRADVSQEEELVQLRGDVMVQRELLERLRADLVSAGGERDRSEVTEN